MASRVTYVCDWCKKEYPLAPYGAWSEKPYLLLRSNYSWFFLWLGQSRREVHSESDCCEDCAKIVLPKLGKALKEARKEIEKGKSK